MNTVLTKVEPTQAVICIHSKIPADARNTDHSPAPGKGIAPPAQERQNF
jgi:hypothetical protein